MKSGTFKFWKSCILAASVCVCGGGLKLLSIKDEWLAVRSWFDVRWKTLILVCSLKNFFKKLIMGFCREFDSEQLLILNIMLKIRSYSSGNRRNLERAYGFCPTKRTFGKDFFTVLAHKPNFRFHMSKKVHFPEK